MTARRLVTTILLLTFLQVVLGFGHVPNSPCTDLCSGNPQNTLQNDVVCLDDDYFNTADGQAFRKCVACELNSTAVDTANNQSDVTWGLCMQCKARRWRNNADVVSTVNLRYTVSECLFATPEQRISISNPCVVTCQPLSNAIGYLLSNDSTTNNPSLGWCDAGRFDDATINNCAFCYGLIPQQLFLANSKQIEVLQALHVECRQPPTPGTPFFPDAETIFNATLISGPSPVSSTATSSGGLHGWKLAIAIALPVVGGILILCAACFCCFVYTRRKRRRMAETGRMSRLHDSWGEAAQYMDGPAYEPEMTAAQEQEMKPLSPQWMQDDHQQRNSPALRSSPGMRVSPGIPTEVVGPGEGQIQDPNLHERYLGTPTNLGEDEIGVARGGGSGLDQHSPDAYHSPEVYHSPEAYQGANFQDQVIAGPSGTHITNNEHYHEGRQQDERGQWV